MKQNDKKEGCKKGCRNSCGVSNANLEQDTGDAKIPKDETPEFNSPVDLHVHHIRKRQCDLDGCSVKAAIDGIVARGILPDDSTLWIKSIKTTCSQGEPEKTIFRFEES